MDKKKELMSYLLKAKGILSPADQEAEIAKMAAACPAATAADKGLTTDIDKAYETMMIEQGTQAPTQVAPKVGSQPVAVASSEELAHIQKTLVDQSSQRAAASQGSSIEQLVLDRPAPADIIPAGTKGAIVQKSWDGIMAKIETGEYVVCEDDGEEVDADKRIASKTNFEALKAAVAAGTPVNVYIGKQSFSELGYIANLANANGAGSTLKQMTREDMLNYVVLETAGYILSSDKKPGVKLRYTQGTTNANDPGARKPGKTVLATANKKAAIEAGSYVVSRTVNSEAEETNLKSDLCFRVAVNTEGGKPVMLADGVTQKKRTIRVPVKASVPGTTRDPKFVDVFGTGIRESNANLTDVPTGDQIKKITEAQRNAIASLRAKANAVDTMSEMAQFKDKLSAFDAPAAQAPVAAI